MMNVNCIQYKPFFFLQLKQWNMKKTMKGTRNYHLRENLQMSISLTYDDLVQKEQAKLKYVN